MTMWGALDWSQKKSQKKWLVLHYFSPLKHFLWTTYLIIDVTTTKFCLTGYPKNITLFLHLCLAYSSVEWADGRHKRQPTDK